jgi:hypothetical protein
VVEYRSNGVMLDSMLDVGRWAFDVAF